jgi:hypothetical protein
MKVKAFDIWGTSSFTIGLEAICLRAEEGAAKAAAGTAKDVGAGLGNTAAGELGQVQPFFSREMHAEHGFDPTQLNEMLTAAGAGTGAAAGAADTEMQRQAASTGNASATSMGQDQLARERMKNAAGVSEGIAAQDVMGAKQLNQQGAAGMSGLYGENLKGQLDAMGQVSGDINAATNASKTGWLQNAEGVAKTAADVASGAGALGYKPLK